jgi:5-hydroxyisourate hydrolase-like protein (transthyretin family)
MRIKLLLLTCLFTVSGLLAKANDGELPPDNGGETKKTDITGGVVDAESKKPLNNVNVVVYSAGNKKEKVMTTDANGNYNFDDLKPGTYKLVFEKTGYRKVTKDKITIRSDEGFQINVEMYEHVEHLIMPGNLFFDFE